MSKKKDINQLTKLAEDQGWRVTHTRKGHVKYISPEGAIVIGPSTPDGPRAKRNLLAHLRRAGLHDPGKGG